jgi:hypothetical protein
MGGTVNYERAFFTDKYLLTHPEHEDKILELKDLVSMLYNFFHYVADAVDRISCFQPCLVLVVKPRITRITRKY